MKALILTLALAISANIIVHSQDKKSVVIGTMIDKPNAILVINPPNSDQGFLLPQLTTTQRLSIAPSSPQDDGLMVFDITDKSFYYWSGNAWIKGLGDTDNQVLNYDAATQQLTLSSGGGTVNLNTLKEIPSPVGNTGKFLTTDGTTLSWATISSAGDITSIIAGQGLNGGGTTGDITLSANPDGSTINFNGTNQLQLADNAVTPAKIANGGGNKVLTTGPTGAAVWEDRSSFDDDNQNLILQAGNILSIDNGTPANLNGLTAGGQVSGTLDALTVVDGTINNQKLATDAVHTPNILNGAVTPIKIEPGTNNQILVTSGATVAWADPTTLPTNVSVDGITIVGDGSAGNALKVADDGITANQIATNAVGASELQNGAVDNLAIQTDAVNSTHIADGTITGTDIQGNTIANTNLQDGAVNSNKIADNSIAPIDINSTGSNKVLTTDGAGTVTWDDRSSFTDNQNLSLPGGNILNIENGTSADLNTLTANGKVTGPLNNLAIQTDAISSTELADNAVDGAAIQAKAVDVTKILQGNSNQVLATDAVGANTVWTDLSNLIPTISVDGTTITGNGTSTPLSVNTISGLKISDGTVQRIDLEDDAIDGAKLADNAVISTHILDETITSADILNNTITTSDLADDAVDDTKLADNAVHVNNILNDAVTPAKILQGAPNQILVTNAAGTDAEWADQSTLLPNISVDGSTIIGDGSGTPLAVNLISGTNILDGTIATADLTDDAVDGNKLADNAVSSAHIVDGTVTSGDILNNTIATVDIADDAVDGNKLADNAVSSAHIVDGTITSGDILDNTIATADLADDAVDDTKLADNAVRTNNILNDAVTPAKILQGTPNQILVTNGAGTDAVWADQSTLVPNISVDGATIIGDGSGTPLAVNLISGVHIADGTIETGDLEDDAVDGNKLADDAVTSAHIADGTVTSGDILDNTIATGDIVDDAINGNKLADDAVTSTHILDGTVTSGDILNSTIATDDLADDAVDGSKLADDAVNTNHILNDAVTPTKILHGAPNQVLVTNAAGTNAEWADQNTLVPNITVDGATIIGDGAGTPLAVNLISGPNISDGSIATADLADDAVDGNKLADNAVTSAHILDGTVTSGDILNNTIATADLADDAVDGNKLADNAVNTNHILNDAVTPAKILQGAPNQVLVTNGAGTDAVWADQNTLVPNITVDGATIIGDGSGTPLAVNLISGTHISDGTIATADLADDAVDGNKLDDDAVTSAHILNETITSGDILNSTIATADLADDAVDGNKLADNAVTSAHIVDGSVTSGDILNSTIVTADLADDAVDGNKLADNAVNTNHIVNDAVTPAKILQGAPNQVLVTNGAGTDAVWADQSTLVPNISVDGATITGDGSGTPLAVNTISGAQITDGTVLGGDIQDNTITTFDLFDGAVTTADILDNTVGNADLATNSVTTTNIVDATIASIDIQDETIASADILDGTITTNDILNETIASADILNGSIAPIDLSSGGNNKVLTTTGIGTVGWTDQSALPTTGDVTGTLAATTVTKIQNRNVSSTAPTNGQTLIWNNATSTWVPGPIVPTPVPLQYYAVDPVDFQDAGSTITAGVHLPDGAVVTGVTVYYQYLLLGSITTTFSRKAYATAATQNVANGSSPLISLGAISAGTIAVNGGNATIDNSTYSYRIQCSFTLVSSNAIHGIRIEYTK